MHSLHGHGNNSVQVRADESEAQNQEGAICALGCYFISRSGVQGNVLEPAERDG